MVAGNNKIYKNLPYKKIYLFRFLFIMLSIATGLTIYLVYTTPLDILYKVLYVLITWTLVGYLGPMLILYFNYRSYNKNTIFQISSNAIIYEDALKKREFTFEEIAYIEFNLSYPLYDNRWRLFFWDEYYYAVIKLKNRERLIVTCLLFNELKQRIPVSLIRKRRRVFPLVQIEERVNLKNELVNKSIELEKKVKSFMKKFENKSKLELEGIVKSKNKYQLEATQAAENLLKLLEKPDSADI
ncbi:hypothetical protein [Polaribacter sp. HL-MS24]|uniref:hypothetical protein n=1 Tax=Polaribacter sp. HL-MS24 TaxID=3077735 RepID=UPI00293457EA|nr:hypothetical protein [Polaribacter sp. HL-MS24]WOC41059.1 hypothetical protein RRF69_04685 [Polaribacter sp. HL-MS24]